METTPLNKIVNIAQQGDYPVNHLEVFLATFLSLLPRPPSPTGKDSLEPLLQILVSSVKHSFYSKRTEKKMLSYPTIFVNNEHCTCDVWTKNLKQLFHTIFRP